MEASDGKMQNIDVADTEELLHIIQTVPSSKVEPFKLRLAKAESERLDELAVPEITINRALHWHRNPCQPGFSGNSYFYIWMSEISRKT